mgnify:CR=1 FL=1
MRFHAIVARNLTLKPLHLPGTVLEFYLKGENHALSWCNGVLNYTVKLFLLL